MIFERNGWSKKCKLLVVVLKIRPATIGIRRRSTTHRMLTRRVAAHARDDREDVDDK